MDYTNLGSYMLFLFLWMATPDTSFAGIARGAMKYGIKGGLLTAFGTVACDAMFVILTVVGIAEFLNTYPQVLSIFRKVAGAYIFYIGFDIILSTFKEVDQKKEKKISGEPLRLFLTGFLINASNPVVLGGIIAAVLTFFDFEKGIGHLAFYSFLVPFSTFYVGSCIAILFGNSIIRKIILPYLKWFERLSGSIICFLATMIIFA